jgi:hypothetical protein
MSQPDVYLEARLHRRRRSQRTTLTAGELMTVPVTFHSTVRQMNSCS